MPRRSSGRTGGYGGRSGGSSRTGGYSGGRSHSTSRSPGYSSASGYRSTGYASRPTSNPYTTQVQSRNLAGMGLGSMIATGMAIGGGSALGHHLVGNMLGGHGRAQYYANQPVISQPKPIQATENEPVIQGEGQTTQKPIENPCADYNFKFIECLRDNQDNISRCQNMFDDMLSCEKILNNI